MNTKQPLNFEQLASNLAKTALADVLKVVPNLDAVQYAKLEAALNAAFCTGAGTAAILAKAGLSLEPLLKLLPLELMQSGLAAAAFSEIVTNEPIPRQQEMPGVPDAR